jgi:hypothetical protein
MGFRPSLPALRLRSWLHNRGKTRVTHAAELTVMWCRSLEWRLATKDPTAD